MKFVKCKEPTEKLVKREFQKKKGMSFQVIKPRTDYVKLSTSFKLYRKYISTKHD